MRRVVIVNDKMQQGYRHELSASVGSFGPQFRPNLTPKQMLELGDFGVRRIWAVPEMKILPRRRRLKPARSAANNHGADDAGDHPSVRLSVA